jgi:outer membrane protein assembly factor BamB
MDLSTMGRGSAPKTELEWKLFCLDEATGEVLWESALAKTKSLSENPS